MKSLSGEQIQDLEHYLTPHLEHDKPDTAVIHIESKNVSYNNLDIDVSILAGNIIKIGNKCNFYGLEAVVTSSLFIKESNRFSSLIRKINDELLVLESFINFILFHMITSIESIYVGMVYI